MSDLAAAIREYFRAKIDAEALTLKGIGTSTTAQPGPTLNVEAYVAKYNQLMEEHRRTNVRVRISLFAPTQPVVHQTERDGRIIECEHPTAMAIHRKVPLALERVEGPQSALFRVATSFDTFVPAVLPAPPYGLPRAAAEESS